MKKIITLFASMVLLCVFAFTAFASEQVKVIKHFDVVTTEAFSAYRNSIVEVTFKNSDEVPKEAFKSWSVGVTPQMEIMAWMERNSEESVNASADRYNLYIGADGGFDANENMSWFFKEFTNLKKLIVQREVGEYMVFITRHKDVLDSDMTDNEKFALLMEKCDNANLTTKERTLLQKRIRRHIYDHHVGKILQNLVDDLGLNKKKS